jgi:hypothetical protein
VEPDARFYRRRAQEELAAARRAVTAAARERRMQLADAFLERLKVVESQALFAASEVCVSSEGYRSGKSDSVFDWAAAPPAHQL